MTVTAHASARRICDVLPEVGRPTVDGVTLGRTACCDTFVQRAVVRLAGSELVLWFGEDGKQRAICRCGGELPDAGRWRS